MANTNIVVGQNFSLATVPNQQYGEGATTTLNLFSFTGNQIAGIIVINQTDVMAVVCSPIGAGTDNSMQCTNTVNLTTGLIGLAGGSLTLTRSGTVAQLAQVMVISRT